MKTYITHYLILYKLKFILINNMLYNMKGEQEYNFFKRVHCFFYTIENKKSIKLLLTKKLTQNHFSELTSEVTELDVSPILAISRAIPTEFKGLFCKTNLELLKQNINLGKENLRKPLPRYKLHEDELFLEWLYKFSDNVIQYDSLEGEMIYFYELDNLDFKILNNLKDETGCEFKYFSYEFKNDLFDSDISSKTRELMKLFDFAKHIFETKKMLKDETLINKYIILSSNDKRYEDELQHIVRRALFQGLYKSNNEKWLYYCADDELPGEDILNKVKAILVPGSPLHLYDNPPGREKVRDFLKKVINDYTHIKLAGFCYGHQMITYALGGNIEFMGTTITYIEDIEIDDSFWELDFVKKSGVEKQSSIALSQCHSDEVTVMPKEMILYGSSKSCKNEIFLSKDKRLFTVQGHPEYSPEHLFFRSYKMVFSHLSDSEEDLPEYEKIKQYWLTKLGNKELGVEFRRIFYSFIKMD
jgi:GMP synthase-like glutamine amidotransferase